MTKYNNNKNMENKMIDNKKKAESDRKYRLAHLEEVRLRERNYKKNNREKVNAWKRENYQKNRERILAQKREYKARKKQEMILNGIFKYKRGPQTSDHNKKVSESLREGFLSGRIKPIIHPFKGKTGVYSKETLEANRNAHLNTEPWNKGKTGIYTLEQRKKLSEFRKDKTFEEIYGEEKAQQVKDKITKALEKNVGWHHSGETKAKLKITRAKQITPVKDTSIEIKLQEFLKQLGINFYTHQYINIQHAYQCDFYISIQPGINKKTILEADGDYWHGNQEVFPNLNEMQLCQKEEDAVRTRELGQAGFIVIRLWESEINKMTLEDFKKKLLSMEVTN